MRLLLIEPDSVVGASARMALERAGHHVHIVTSGQQAIDALDDQQYELLVLEPQLGLHNGIEFLYELRSYPEWQRLPVIMWTMNQQLPQALYRAPLEQLGISEVLYKPRSSLARLVREVATVAS